MTKNAEQAVAILRAKGAVDPIDFAVLFGFGLAGIPEALSGGVSAHYLELPGFHEIDEPGSATGRLSLGRFEGANICLLQGQSHFYGAGDPTRMLTPLRTVKLLGARYLLIFAGAGSLKPDLYPGALMQVTDHVALFGLNPLIGLNNDDAIPSLHDAYDSRLQRRFRRAAAAAGVPMQEGVFMWVSGPTFATPFEARVARQMGADALGFGIAPEVILSRAIGLRVAAIVAATHAAAGAQEPGVAEVQRHALGAGVPLRRLLRAFMKTADTM